MSDLIDMLLDATPLMNQLKAHEGQKQFAYRCSANKLTIGIGRNIDPDGGIGLDEVEMAFLLCNDISRCLDEVMIAFPWTQTIDAPRRDAFVNMCFNLGVTRMKTFKRALAYGEAHQWADCSRELLRSKWAQQVGYRAEEIADQVRTGMYAAKYL